MATAENDPLVELLVDAGTIDKARIAAALKGVVAIDRGSGRVAIQPAFHSLSLQQKVLAYLLGRKVAVLVGVAEVESASAAEVAADTGMRPGSARPTLSALARDHRISKEGSAYTISSAQINAAIAQIAAPDGDGERAALRSGSASTTRTRRKRSTRPQPAARRVPLKSPTGKAKSKHADVEGSRESTAKRKSPKSAANEIGPMKLVEKLIEQGYFDSPRTLRDIQVRLKEKSGYAVKITTLSPNMTRLLRRGVLDREQIEGGKYAYRAT
jgi:hypothetical protein